MATRLWIRFFLILLVSTMNMSVKLSMEKRSNRSTSIKQNKLTNNNRIHMIPMCFVHTFIRMERTNFHVLMHVYVAIYNYYKCLSVHLFVSAWCVYSCRTRIYADTLHSENSAWHDSDVFVFVCLYHAYIRSTSRFIDMRTATLKCRSFIYKPILTH